MEERYKAKPENLPEPTYWPFLLAFGTMLIFWGFLSNIVVSAIGAVIFIVSLGGWITDLYKEKKPEKDEL
ncbi:hypothetical protein RM553_03085 [Zunongwangia sp. F363]|uniref:Cytochrome c oxidase polypeptide IV n=1 Tax=Autumnicola tepida TaxID=3075595 RepID=A0ABU3C642_9FLAO|nr:hypothetical protein [Zunongwangia sp. F363]MDT0641808.1 hypothetical protein [Zunongwangia sp. F363]